MTVSVAVTGASGRLGSLVCDVVRELNGYELVAELNSRSATSESVDADILVDVSTPDVSEDIVTAAVARGVSVLVGTSGWSAAKIERLKLAVGQAPEHVGVIVVPNFSLGSVLGTAVSEVLAPFFDSIEILETHHANKVDSPSGTAVNTAERIAAARAGMPELSAPFHNQPARGEQIAGVPVHSMRLPGVLAQQEVIFASEGETLTVAHNTTSPDAYRAGIRASLLSLPSARGVVVGLDRVLGLDLGPTR
jgi:4-hydroxy-tetrahydrodipicolinate reductase